MAGDGSRLLVREESGVLRVELLDRTILDDAIIDQLGLELGRLVESATRPRVILSFSSVEQLSSLTLGTLITLHNKIRARSGQLRLADMSPKIRQLFVVSQLDKVFEIHASTDEAAASMQ